MGRVEAYENSTTTDTVASVLMLATCAGINGEKREGRRRKWRNHEIVMVSTL